MGGNSAEEKAEWCANYYRGQPRGGLTEKNAATCERSNGDVRHLARGHVAREQWLSSNVSNGWKAAVRSTRARTDLSWPNGWCVIKDTAENSSRDKRRQHRNQEDGRH
jgi:hypothetical protein